MLKKYFLLLNLLAAVLYFWPQLHYQAILSQEDHGRDLYVFAQVAHGKTIYKDIWWDYGPLMPYYYAGFDLLFGLKISSVLLGKFILNILGPLFFYLASCEVMSIPWAFLSALFFMLLQQDFFHTYNHTAGLVLFLMLLWLILKQIRQSSPKNTFGALGVCLTIGFVKINFGIAALAATLISTFMIETFSHPKTKKKQGSPFNLIYIVTLMAVPLCWILVYYSLTFGLTSTEINQCLHYFDNDKSLFSTPWQSINGFWDQINIISLDDWLAFLNSLILVIQGPFQALTASILLTFSITLLKLLTYPIICGSSIAALILSFTKRFEEKRLKFWLVQFVLWLFFIFNFHEFLVTNTWYRFFWSEPFILFFFFWMLSTSVSFAPRKLRYCIGVFCISFFILSTLNTWITTKDACKPNKFLHAPTGQVYVGNENDWVNTFNNVTAYLHKNLKKDELFLAIPRDSLFYYLTDKPSPVWLTVFFKDIHVTPEEEHSIIQELEKKKVNYILLSNRIKAGSPQLGEFGNSYCPLIYHYVMENFTPVYRYGGNWNAPAGWADNHAVIILKRK